MQIWRLPKFTPHEPPCRARTTLLLPMRTRLLKSLMIAGWVLLALEGLFVVSLLLTKNMGDDAAGRGMATGFGMLLAPVVLAAGALLLWGTRGGPKPALWAGLFMVSTPLLFGAVSMAKGTLYSLSHMLGRAQQGSFDDRSLTKLARAIERQDTNTVRTLLASTKPDWNARSQTGRTILGHAVMLATDDYEGPGRVVFVRMLLDAGAPPANNAISPGRTSASVTEHNLVYHLYGVHNPAALAVLDMVLAAGASPNVVDEDDRPIYFSTYTVLPALEILGKHGADFTRLDPREDLQGQNALMNAIDMRMWDCATFFLKQGLSPDYTAPDGRSARTILAKNDPPGTGYAGDEDRAHAAFIEALSRVK